MNANVSTCRRRGQWAAVSLLAVATAVWAAEAGAKTGNYQPADKTVEMFEAIQNGQIAVQLIPKDSTQCCVLIKNKTDQPLNVKLPEAFAGVPALAQAAGAGAGRASSSSSTTHGAQTTGGGMGGMGGMGMGGMGGGMGMMNVPPEHVGQLKVATVCLEHGKAEPRAAVPYEIKPLDSFTAKPGVHELCEMLGSGRINQRAAQAAAWHLNNGMSWQELAAKRLRFANGTSQPYFSPQEIQSGMSIAAVATRLAAERQQQKAGTEGSIGRQ
jgi:hypothetical protein